MVYVFITRKSFRVEPATRDEPLALFLSRRDGCPKIILSLMYICPKRNRNDYAEDETDTELERGQGLDREVRVEGREDRHHRQGVQSARREGRARSITCTISY